MHMILFVNSNISGVQLMFKYEVGKGKSFLINFKGLLAGDEFSLDEKLFFKFVFSYLLDDQNVIRLNSQSGNYLNLPED